MEGRDETLTLIQLFDALGFHPGIVEVSRELFADRYYAPAIFEAFKRVEIAVRCVSGLKDRSGKSLMAEVFNEQRPRIQLNTLANRSDRDEQEGFKFIFMGSMQGIRNPKGHEHIVQNDAFKTLEYLGLASLLLKRIDDAQCQKHS